MAAFKLVVLSRARSGREAEFETWYTQQHLPDVLEIPGILSAGFFRRAHDMRDGGSPKWEYMAEYDCETQDPQSIVDELARRRETGQILLTDAMDDVRTSCFFQPLRQMNGTP
jgi:hypothetical protein